MDIDKDGNKLIDKNEFKTFSEEYFTWPPRDEQLESLWDYGLSELDNNKDGKISLKELHSSKYFINSLIDLEVVK